MLIEYTCRITADVPAGYRQAGEQEDVSEARASQLVAIGAARIVSTGRPIPPVEEARVTSTSFDTEEFSDHNSQSAE